MTTDPQESNVVVEPRDDADPKAINELVRGAVNDAAGAGMFDKKLALCFNTRRMLWEGQTDDGLLPARNKLPKGKLFTWAGAPDIGIPYADEVVVEQTLIRKAAWHRGEVRLGPRELDNADGVQDEQLAASWQSALDYWMDVQRRQIGYQLGLFNTCVEECGYGLMYTGSKRVVRTVKLKMTMDQVLNAMVLQAQASAISDSGRELGEQDVAMIQQAAQNTLNMIMIEGAEGDARLRELLMAVDPDMPKSEARIVARELRRTGTEATYYAPQDDGHEPFVDALVPFINGIHGMDLTGDGRTWWFAKPERLCEADLRVRAASEGWEGDFLEAVLKHENEFMIRNQTWDSRVPSWALSGAGVFQTLNPSEEKFYEVLYVWREIPDSKGRPMVYHTLVHPSEDVLYGFHECSGLEKLPLHAESREEVLYAVQSRGVPEIALKAGMPTIKVLMDAEGARSQLASNPPVVRTSVDHQDIEPGHQVFKTRGHDGDAFFEVPQADQGSLNMLDRVRDQLDRRFFRHPTLTDPDIKRMYREGILLAAAETIREMTRLLWKVMQGKVDNLKVGRIAGRAVNLELSRDSMQGEVDVRVECHVDGLSEDSMDRTMEFAAKLMAMGADNVDLNELANVLARMNNPGLARRIILPGDVAAEKIRQDQRNRISNMFSGSQMHYPDRQTGIPHRMDEMGQWQADPENMARLQSSPRFLQQMEAEMEYLQNQGTQYGKNPARGRAVVPKSAPAS